MKDAFSHSALGTLLSRVKKNIQPEEALSTVALVLSAAVASFIVSKVYATNPDAIVGPYLFHGGPFPHGLLMPDCMQGILKYNHDHMYWLLPVQHHAARSQSITSYFLFLLW